MKDICCGQASDVALDLPVKAACESAWREWVEVRGAVQALPPRIGQFGWMRCDDPSAVADLKHLVVNRGRPLLLLQKHTVTLPRNGIRFMSTPAVQMVMQTRPDVPDMDGISTLQSHDAEEMLQLAKICKPGPFEIGTHLLGTFLGLRERGKLVAMAGQRMRFSGWVEISGVCVHPDLRGGGRGSGLMRAMVHLILAGGAKPFLHTYRENHQAISLYERLGFTIRSDMQMISIDVADEATS